MDLRNNQITVGEILSHPEAKAVLEREFPQFRIPALLRAARGMTLQDILQLAGGRFPQSKIDRVLEELKAI